MYKSYHILDFNWKPPLQYTTTNDGRNVVSRGVYQELARSVRLSDHNNLPK